VEGATEDTKVICLEFEANKDGVCGEDDQDTYVSIGVLVKTESKVQNNALTSL